MKYSLAEKQKVQADLNLDSLPTDEFMRLLAEANALASEPRPAGMAPGVSPEAVKALVDARTAEMRERALDRVRQLEHLRSGDPTVCTVCGRAREFGTECCAGHNRHPPKK